MRRTEPLQGLRAMKFEEVYGPSYRGEPSQLNAVDILGVSVWILTVIRLDLPHKLQRSLACTNDIENALGTVRQVSRNVKRWRHTEMALRWTAAGLLKAEKTFRRLEAYRPAARPPQGSPGAREKGSGRKRH